MNFPIPLLEFLLLTSFSQFGDSEVEVSPVDIKMLSRMCPKQANSTMDINLIEKLRYHPESKRCYTLKSQGPCGHNMVFYAKDNIHGNCDCSESERILIYHKATNQCYFIFQKGYCAKTNEWLDMRRVGKPYCRKDLCAQRAQATHKDLVNFKRRCVEVGKFAAGCQSGEIVGFTMKKRTPICVPSRVSPVQPGMRSMGVPTTPCGPGSVMAIAGTCHPPFDFD